MGESLSTWTPSCNGSVRVELDGQRTTSDSGALLLREALDNSGAVEALEDNLVDPRHPLRIRHSLASQLRTLVLHAFFLVTNLGKFDWPPEKVLALYRKRGSAEAHMGEVKSALDVHLSSTDRGASTVQDVMARNEVSLL
ncbi:transposase, partial [Cutibacterium acnes]